ncbi:MAG: hypothetical protein KAS05_00130 [Candidatus Omnitrophica bacterium]|nr:hypothetical protein [Candidatus Omnitrophota bacterium]
MKKYLFILSILILSGCISTNKTFVNIDYANGIDKYEATTMAKREVTKKAIESYNPNQPRIMRNLDTKVEKDYWLISFPGRRKAKNLFMTNFCYLIAVDKKTGAIALSEEVIIKTNIKDSCKHRIKKLKNL